MKTLYKILGFIIFSFLMLKLFIFLLPFFILFMVIIFLIHKMNFIKFKKDNNYNNYYNYDTYNDYNYYNDSYSNNNNYNNSYSNNNYYNNSYSNNSNYEYKKACEVLGVDENLDFEEKKKIRKQLLMKYHPDFCKTESEKQIANKVVNEINNAWEIIEKYEN